MTTDPTAPTCSDARDNAEDRTAAGFCHACKFPLGRTPHAAPMDCIRALAEDHRDLRAAVERTASNIRTEVRGVPAPAPAEPVRKFVKGWMWTGDMETLECVHCGEHAAVKDTRQFPPHGVCQACMTVRDVFVPTVEASRCKEPNCAHQDGHDGGHEEWSTSPAPSANAEPERYRYQMNECGIVNRTPIPPRPEGQGTVEPVTHGSARGFAFSIERDYQRALMDCYIDEQEAREQAQAAEIESLRAELAALKQPVPAAAISSVAVNHLKCPSCHHQWHTNRCEEKVFIGKLVDCECYVSIQNPPAQVDVTNRDAALEFIKNCSGAIADESLTKLLDAAEKRGRASRDGVVETAGSNRERAERFMESGYNFMLPEAVEAATVSLTALLDDVARDALDGNEAIKAWRNLPGVDKDIIIGLVNKVPWSGSSVAAKLLASLGGGR